MTHIYCVICQARVGTDRSKYQKLINEELINTINLSRPDIINQLKKNDNGIQAKSGDYVHKTCKKKSEYLFKTKQSFEPKDIPSIIRMSYYIKNIFC